MNRRVSHLIAGWRTGLPRPVLILQAGNALNYFGYGLILPFEIIYLHQIRGFSTSIAGLVLAATQGTAAIRSEEHTSELQSQSNLVCRLLLEQKKSRKALDLS